MNRFQHHCSRLLSFGSLLGVLAIACAAQAQTCPVYPIALSGQMLSNVPVNTVVMDVQPGNFSWLSWAGDLSEPTLVTDLPVLSDRSFRPNAQQCPCQHRRHGCPAGQF